MYRKGINVLRLWIKNLKKFGKFVVNLSQYFFLFILSKIKIFFMSSKNLEINLLWIIDSPYKGAKDAKKKPLSQANYYFFINIKNPGPKWIRAK